MILLPARFALTAVLGALASALVLGIPTDVIPNDLFGRMTPVRWYDLPVLVIVSVLSALLMASHWGVAGGACPPRRPEGAGAIGAIAGWLAIGCPVCNKLVVLALGSSGALTWFAPLQPWLAALSIGLLAAAVALRWRTLIGAGLGISPART